MQLRGGHVSFALLCFIAACISLNAQSMPAGQLSSVHKKIAALNSVTPPSPPPPGQLAPAIVPPPDPCAGINHLDQFLPLKTADIDLTNCFYNVKSAFAPITQVKFLYGFGGGDSKTLSSDLTSIQFPTGWQLTLGQSVTAGTSTQTTVTTTTTPTSGQPTTSSSTLTTDTPATTIAKLEQGGDVFVRGAYPVFYNNNKSAAGYMVFFVPRLNANFSGFGSQATITEATEYNYNLSMEAYSELRGDKGLLYGDIRTGFQWIQPEVAQKLSLGTQNKFGLTQLAFGVEFAGLVRIGAQRFVGPSAAFGTTPASLSQWHIVMSLVPQKKQD